MNRAVGVVLLSLLFCSLGWSQTFEGIITFRATGRSVEEFTYSTKGDKIRMDMEPSPGMGMAMIVDTRANSMLVVRDDAKIYFEMNMDQLTP